MMYEAFHSTLSALRKEFARAADRHPNLCFEEVGVSLEGDEPQEEMWKSFIAANRDDERSECWHIPKRANACGRFYGDVGGFEEFKRLAESLDLVLGELDDLYNEDDGEADFYRCLRTVLNAAFLYRTPLLWAKSRTWGIEGDKAEMLEEEMLTPSDGGAPYPAHPKCLYLVHNVFTSSAAFIDTILHPHGTVNTGVADESLLSLRNDERESEESFVQQEAAEKPSPYAFRFDGVSWHLRFPGDYGDKECPFNDMKGLRFYAKILANKGKPVTADDLYGHDRKRLGGNLPPDKAISKAGLDAAFRAFDLVAEQVRVAKEKEDQDETKLLLERLNALQDAIEKDFDPITGKIRVIQDKRTGNPPRAAERVMRDALLAINKKMPKLMIYLQRNCKKITQNTWQYESVDKIEWEF